VAQRITAAITGLFMTVASAADAIACGVGEKLPHHPRTLQNVEFRASRMTPNLGHEIRTAAAPVPQ